MTMKLFIYFTLTLMLFSSCKNQDQSIQGQWFLSTLSNNQDLKYMEIEITNDSIFLDIDTHYAISSLKINGDSMSFIGFDGKYNFLLPDTLVLYDQFGGISTFRRFTNVDLKYFNDHDLYQFRRFLFYSTHLEDKDEINMVKDGLWDRFKYRDADFGEDIEISNPKKMD